VTSLPPGVASYSRYTGTSLALLLSTYPYYYMVPTPPLTFTSLNEATSAGNRPFSASCSNVVNTDRPQTALVRSRAACIVRQSSVLWLEMRWHFTVVASAIHRIAHLVSDANWHVANGGDIPSALDDSF
jgi:hypothetical protein